MYQLYYQYPNTWFGDCMPFGKDGKFYLFHQRDTRRPGPFGEPFGWSLAVTSDFVHYEDYGTVLPGGGDDAQDQFIFAGTVFEAEGRYHAMYTGYNRDYEKQGKKPQILMKAESDDLIHWQKNGEKLVEPQPGYEPQDWRDPFVFWDEELGLYRMILGTRKKSEHINRGCSVWFTSPDLKNWEFQGDFWAPNLYSMHEMPDLFRIGDWWYLLISEYSEKNKIVYRRSKSLNGPWLAPTDDAFDGRCYYAGRTAFDGKRRVLFGWVNTRDTWQDSAEWTWGGTFVPHEVFQREDGSLGVKLPDSIREAFEAPRLLAQQAVLETVDQNAELPLAQIQHKFCKWEARVRFSEGTRAFGVRLCQDERTGEAYDFRLLVGENRLSFDRIPFIPSDVNNKGLERPIRLSVGEEYRLQLIVDDDIAVLYVNGVALSVRMYRQPGTGISLYVTDGRLEILESSISDRLKD